MSNDFPSLDTENFIRTSNRIHPMGDKKNNFPCTFLEKIFHNECFIFRIELVCSFIEYKDGTILKENTNYGKNLIFPSREFYILSNFRIETERRFLYLFIQSEIFQKPIEFCIRNFSRYSEEKVDSNGRISISTIGIRYL